jgi:hypothetical protein
MFGVSVERVPSSDFVVEFRWGSWGLLLWGFAQEAGQSEARTFSGETVGDSQIKRQSIPLGCASSLVGLTVRAPM